jgi:hypothetical protein
MAKKKEQVVEENIAISGYVDTTNGEAPTVETVTTTTEGEGEVQAPPPQQTIEDWLEGNKELMLNIAQGVESKFKGWFNLVQFTSKTQWKNPQDALHILNLLKLSNLLQARMFGTGENKVEQYSIQITKDHQKKLTELAIAKHEDEIKSIEAKLVGLRLELKKLSKE